MNKNSEEKIRGEYASFREMQEISDSGDRFSLSQYIKKQTSYCHINARWGNVVDIYTVLKNAVEEELAKYEAGEIDALSLIKSIAEYHALAKNDQRDGLLLIEDLFGVPPGVQGTRENENNLIAHCGTNDWSIIQSMLYPNIYTKKTPSNSGEIVEQKQIDAALPDAYTNKKSQQQNNDYDRPLGKLLEELNGLIGLHRVKSEVSSLINLIQMRNEREKRGLKQPDMSLHLVFTGNPGTGKTTIARLIAQIYKQLGILSKGHFIEAERADLCGGYVGQTAIKTKKVIESAMGGVLFIDEAYSLTSKHDTDYGREAVETLLKSMEDHRNDLIVIVAGYTQLMGEFINSNPGLRSRFNKFIEFDDYDPDELYAIFHLISKKAGFHLNNESDHLVKVFFKQYYDSRDATFANARDVRNFFEKAMTNQANRLAGMNAALIPTDELNLLTKEDIAHTAFEYGMILEPR